MSLANKGNLPKIKGQRSNSDSKARAPAQPYKGTDSDGVFANGKWRWMARIVEGKRDRPLEMPCTVPKQATKSLDWRGQLREGR